MIGVYSLPWYLMYRRCSDLIRHMGKQLSLGLFRVNDELLCGTIILPLLIPCLQAIKREPSRTSSQMKAITIQTQSLTRGPLLSKHRVETISRYHHAEVMSLGYQHQSLLYDQTLSIIPSLHLVALYIIEIPRGTSNPSSPSASHSNSPAKSLLLV